MRGTILVTGFGPFPGAPVNPTQALVKALARMRHPNIRLVSHIFRTSYAAVDRDLPALLARHQPDALLMFGLHGRARTLRLEMLARNARARVADVDGLMPGATITAGGPSCLAMPCPAARLLAALRRGGVPVALSRNAGGYLCNYLCWRAAQAAQNNGPRLAAFVHVPPIRAKPMPRRNRPGRLQGVNPAGLVRAGANMLTAMAGCLGSVGNRQ